MAARAGDEDVVDLDALDGGPSSGPGSGPGSGGDGRWTRGWGAGGGDEGWTGAGGEEGEGPGGPGTRAGRRRGRLGSVAAGAAVAVLAAAAGAVGEGVHARGVADQRVQRAQAVLSLRLEDLEVSGDRPAAGRRLEGTGADQQVRATVFSLVRNTGPATVHVVGARLDGRHLASVSFPLEADVAPGTIATLPLPAVVHCQGVPPQGSSWGQTQRPRMSVRLRVAGTTRTQSLELPYQVVDDLSYTVADVCHPDGAD